MAGPGEEPPLHPRLIELSGLDPGAHRALIERITEAGYQPGCWLDPPAEDLLAGPLDPLLGLEQTAELTPEELSEPKEFDGTHSWDPPQGGEAGWVIISQVCDLVRDLATEPLVQLALLREAEEDVDLASVWRRSSRLIPLDPTGKSSRHYIDLRCQAFLPKHLLPDYPPRQAIPTDAEFAKRRPRRRFALRVGNRYSRAGIPTAIVLEIIVPLEAAINKNKRLRKLFDSNVAECLLRPSTVEGGPLALVLLTQHATTSAEFRELEDAFLAEFLEDLVPELTARLDLDACRVEALEEVLLLEWLTAYHLDFDFLTFGSKGDPDSPSPPA
jgi:hypothetical protein